MCKLRCPNMQESKIPPLRPKPVLLPHHPPIAKMLEKELEVKFGKETLERRETDSGSNFEVPILS